MLDEKLNFLSKVHEFQQNKTIDLKTEMHSNTIFNIHPEVSRSFSAFLDSTTRKSLVLSRLTQSSECALFLAQPSRA